MDYTSLIKYQNIINKINELISAVKSNKFLNEFLNHKKNLKEYQQFIVDLKKMEKDLNESFPRAKKYIQKQNKNYLTIQEKIKSLRVLSESENLLKEIDAEIERIKTDESNLNEASLKYEKNLELLPRVEKMIKNLEEYLSKNNQEYINKQEQIKNKLNDLNSEKNKIEKTLSKEILNLYKSKEKELSDNKNVVTILKLIKISQNDSACNCPHCIIDLDNELIKKLKNGELIECGSCRKLILRDSNE